MTIQTIQAGVLAIAKEVKTFRAVYDYPVFDIGRALPALTILYTGLTQVHGPNLALETKFGFELTLYLPLEGRDIEKVWAELLSLAHDVLDKFRVNPGLHGVAWDSLITSGAPIVNVPSGALDKPKWVGHAFQLSVSAEQD